jgi:plasmid stabilization system protein ParE
MKVEILDLALEDLKAGFNFYERRSPGLGSYFYDSVFADIKTLRDNAGIHPMMYGSHRLICKTFPFAVFYTVSQGTVRVESVLDCRQRPAKIKRRIKQGRNRPT